jgi:hypothetical protein
MFIYYCFKIVQFESQRWPPRTTIDIIIGLPESLEEYAKIILNYAKKAFFKMLLFNNHPIAGRCED